MAQVFEPRTRETSTTTGTSDFALAGRMYGSISFLDAATAAGGGIGSTFDCVAIYADTFEEGTYTLAAGPTLIRTTVTRSRHADGTIDATKVSFATGVKTIIGTLSANRASGLVTAITKAVRVDISQSFSVGETAQARANAPPFAAGTRIVFQQTSAPTGWTKDGSHDDKALRVVSGSVGSGGSSPFSTVFGQFLTGGHAISQAELPSVNFNLSGITVNDARTFKYQTLNSRADLAATGSSSAATAYSGTSTVNVVVAGSITASGGTAASGGSDTAHTHAMDIRVEYVDTTICQKD